MSRTPRTPGKSRGSLNHQDVTFEQWLKACDDYVAAIAGVDLDALGDGPSRDSYGTGVTVREYCWERLDDAGFPS